MGKKSKGKGGKYSLPKEIFVSLRGAPSDSQYLEAQPSAAKMAKVCEDSKDGIVVGVYALQEVGTISTETTYKRKRFTKA